MKDYKRYLLRSKETELQEKLLKSQVLQIVSLLVTGLVVWVVNTWAPEFFRHPNLTWWVSAENLFRFWPLFAYALVMTVLAAPSMERAYDAERLLGLGLVTSILAGIWEEIGFRWLYVCTAMLGLALGNLIWGSFLGMGFGFVFLALGVFGFALGMKHKAIPTIIGSIIVGVMGGLILWSSYWVGVPNPIYWLYEAIVIPVVNFVTFGFFSHILYSKTIPQLFVFGMIAANAKFRDGHKYQGLLGMLNAWIIGFVMMHATILYGIGTAIVLHALYDIEIDVVRYVARKTLHR